MAMKFFSEEIANTIRSLSPDAELNGELSPEVLDLIYQYQLFKLFVPEALNGAMIGLPKAVKIFEEAAYIDGSFGWAVTIGSGGGYFAPIFAADVSELLFTPSDAVVAGSGRASGVARYANGGYMVSGSWRYCSGANYATIFTANCVLPDNSIRSFIFTPDQVRVTSDWDAYGLKATASHTITVTDVFVPISMTFDIEDGLRQYRHPVFEYPFMQFAEVSFAAVNIGISKHFLEEALDATQVHDTPETAERYAFVMELIQLQRQILRSAAEGFYEVLERSWEVIMHEGKLPDDVIETVSRSAKSVTSVALSASQRVYPYLGLYAAMENTTINRCWRDLHTASQHIVLKSFE